MREIDLINSWKKDWNKFARDVFDVKLDEKQQEILYGIQTNKRISVVSGAARGKDFLSAVASLCFLYLTPAWDSKGKMIRNTKVALTAPTGGQVDVIMMPEIARLFKNGSQYGLPGRLLNNGIKMPEREWFLIGFKSDDHNLEAWTGFHASNIMYTITEASGINEKVWGAIEGNLQGNSKILIVFNPNKPYGYAARTCKSDLWKHYKLNSLDSPNVKAKRQIINGQVDYEWVSEKIRTEATPISKEEVKIEKNDFEFEGVWYRPSDWFRIKVLGEFPEAAEDVLIPRQWVEAAFERHKRFVDEKRIIKDPLKLGTDVAGMGNDDTVHCFRHGDFVDKFHAYNAGGVANHMETAGHIKNALFLNTSSAFIDTVGEGAGVFSRCQELGQRVYSVKSNSNAKGLTDYTKEYTFGCLRDYLFWAIRDWLNPVNNSEACLPENMKLLEELTEIRWSYDSQGRPTIESKDKIKERLKRSTDHADSLSLTFYPEQWIVNTGITATRLAGMF